MFLFLFFFVLLWCCLVLFWRRKDGDLSFDVEVVIFFLDWKEFDIGEFGVKLDDVLKNFVFLLMDCEFKEFFNFDFLFLSESMIFFWFIVLIFGRGKGGFCNLIVLLIVVFWDLILCRVGWMWWVFGIEVDWGWIFVEFFYLGCFFIWLF